jgi:hypothetical protein
MAARVPFKSMTYSFTKTSWRLLAIGNAPTGRGKLPAGYVFRAKLILMLAEGISFNTIKRRLQTSAPTIIRWKQRFLESGLE